MYSYAPLKGEKGLMYSYAPLGVGKRVNVQLCSVYIVLTGEKGLNIAQHTFILRFRRKRVK